MYIRPLAIAGVASDISGNVGILGTSYPGLFHEGDAKALIATLVRFEQEQLFRKRLIQACAELAGNHSPEAEADKWKSLVKKIIPSDA